MTNARNLAAAELRHQSVSRYNPNSSEEVRLVLAIADIRGKMTEDELTAYNDEKNALLNESTEKKAKRIKAELAAMEANRDSNSI